jgi:hypothetical protein
MLRDNSAHRKSGERGTAKRKVPEQPFEIGNEGVNRVLTRRGSGENAMTRKIRSDHLIGTRPLVYLLARELTGGRVTMQQYHWKARSGDTDFHLTDRNGVDFSHTSPLCSN